MKTILVTGGSGFIGSNFIPQFIARHPGNRVINLDLLTYAGSQANLSELEGNSAYQFVKGDIGDRALVDRLFQEFAVTGVIHFAAESHVDNSITRPEVFVRTNVLGTFVLLDAARSAWMKSPFEPLAGAQQNRFLHISTDEVFGSLGKQGYFTENTPYAPNSPYSASKAGSDFLVRSYFHTYGLNVVTTNCSNNYGPKQHAEKLMPTIIRRALLDQPIPIYGDGLNVRDWLYVTDHVNGVELAFEHGVSGSTYNIGGGNEKTNVEVAETICSVLDTVSPRKGGKPYRELITFVKDRAGHDRRYAINSTKIQTELGWKAQEDFKSGIRKTVEWYLEQFRKHTNKLANH